uniref:RabBD domain-containing protein n=1 Tax=Oryzias latipes TaxID=8090 RepID=A0A3P9IWK4_ORYLA
MMGCKKKEGECPATPVCLFSCICVFVLNRKGHTMTSGGSTLGEELTDEEKEIINGVLARAATMEAMEQQRIQRLSSRLDTIKKTACGDGHSHCLLCAASFGLQGVAAVMCAQCKKVCFDQKDRLNPADNSIVTDEHAIGS